jgi:hypothetical protein
MLSIQENNSIFKSIRELDENGFINLSDGKREIFIQSIDDKEGYSFVSSTNEEFACSEAAVKWAFEQLSL